MRARLGIWGPVEPLASCVLHPQAPLSAISHSPLPVTSQPPSITRDLPRLIAQVIRQSPIRVTAHAMPLSPEAWSTAPLPHVPRTPALPSLHVLAPVNPPTSHQLWSKGKWWAWRQTARGASPDFVSLLGTLHFSGPQFPHLYKMGMMPPVLLGPENTGTYCL